MSDMVRVYIYEPEDEEEPYHMTEVENEEDPNSWWQDVQDKITEIPREVWEQYLQFAEVFKWWQHCLEDWFWIVQEKEKN